MNKLKYYTIFALAVIVSFTACTNDLDVEPIDPNEQTSTNVFKDDAAYKKALAKIYATYAISGQVGGGGGAPDIQGIDENFGNYLRQYWGLQELATDEAIMAWDDATIKNFHWHTWSPNDVFISALYSRIFYTVTASNEFIRATNSRLGSATGEFKTDLEFFQAEARFLRAFSYWHAIDMFGNVPFVTEADLPGAFSPERITRSDLFTYVETELKDLETKLTTKTTEYGRIDRVSAWMLLAKLYANAEIYTGTERNTDALTYLKKVIGEGGYSFDNNYQRMFSADNHTSSEIIFPITFDGLNTQQYGGMTFLLHASNGGGMPLNGIDGGWGGIRTIKELASKFNVTESDFTIEAPEPTPSDSRGMFYFNPENWEWDISNVGTFTQGIGVTKFKNLAADGGEAPNAHPSFVSTDFPVFRLSDAYLMYAEAVLRGGSGGDASTALGYINDLRERAYGDTSGNINAGSLTLDFILDERARELYWECHRRTDLIRFGKFTTADYLWTWKGNAQEGKASDSFRNLYPIPSNDLLANPNLIQNDGY